MAKKDISIQQKKDIARQLYIKGAFTQIEIADKVGISKTSINKWIKAENWDREKISLTNTRQEQLLKIYAQLIEINKVIEDREPGKRYATPPEADTITKLSKSVEKFEKETSLTETITVITEILDWLRPQNIKQSQELSNILDLYVKSKLI